MNYGVVSFTSNVSSYGCGGASPLLDSYDMERISITRERPCLSASRYVRERDKPVSLAAAELTSGTGGGSCDLAIEFNDTVVDLSNLVSQKHIFASKHNAQPVFRQPLLPSVKKKTQLQRQHRVQRIAYPTSSQLRELPEINVSEIFAKCVVKRRNLYVEQQSQSYSHSYSQSHMQYPQSRSHSPYSSSSSSSKKKQDYGGFRDPLNQSRPGAYECNIADDYLVEKPVKSMRDEKPGRITRHEQEHMDWVSSQHGGRNSFNNSTSSSHTGNSFNGGSHTAYNTNSFNGGSHTAYHGNSFNGGTRTAYHTETPVFHRQDSRSEDNSISYNGCYNNHQQQQPKQQPKQPPVRQEMQLEIAPGVFAPIRGSDETWKAIEQGFCTYVDCCICCIPLVCIADADYVLCPECRVVSPTGAVERNSPQGRSFYEKRRGGVGLGLKSRALQHTY